MYKNIIFDLGGVVVDFKPRDFLMDHFLNKSAEDEVFDLTFGSKEWEELDRGVISRGTANRLMLENAARAVSEGGEVTLSAERGASEARIRIADTGRGIPYHLQPHVFDRFVRRERGGPGVGLALVKALVELHGGWAEVESEPGKGETFILHLPIEATSAAAPPELLLG